MSRLKIPYILFILSKLVGNGHGQNSPLVSNVRIVTFLNKSKPCSTFLILVSTFPNLHTQNWKRKSEIASFLPFRGYSPVAAVQTAFYFLPSAFLPKLWR
jgi:hypothetical protein